MIKYLVKKPQAGFTLVEWLVYIFIFLLISGGSITLIFSLSDVLISYRLQQSLLSSGHSIMERVLIEVREADVVNQVGSAFATSTVGKLSLTNSGQTKLFLLNNGKIDLFINANNQGSIHPTNVTVTGLTFFYYQLNTVELVRVKVDLQATSGIKTETWSLTSGAIVRGTYVN